MTKTAEQLHPPHCAFCTGPKNSKEHHWPQWLDPILPPRTPHDRRMNLRVQVKQVGTQNYAINPRILIKQGASHTSRIKSVCIVCNGGWMSGIQMLAKPILTELILGTKKILTCKEQEIIRPWMVMTDMTAEFSEKASITTTFDERRQFKDDRQPPNGWMIFAGRYKGKEWKTRFCHNAFNTTSPNAERPDIHTTLFVVGEFFFFIFAVYENTFSPKTDFIRDFQNAFPLVQIWPSLNRDIQWDSFPFFTDKDANELADFMSLNMEKIRFTYNPFKWV
jgi:hypothetical protein